MRTLLVAIFSLSVAHSAVADTLQFTPQLRSAIGDQLGIDPNSRFMRRIEENYRRTYDERSRQTHTEPAPKKEPKIYRHIVGDEGIPFPPEAEVKATYSIARDQVEAIARQTVEYAKEHAMRRQTMPKLPECTDNGSERVAIGEAKGGDKNGVAFDMLFIRSDKVPMDPDELFGHSAMVRPYSSEKPNVIAASAVGVGVDCLPYRLRVTTRYTYRHRGKDALKNYDEDPDGPGKLDPRALEGVMQR